MASDLPPRLDSDWTTLSPMLLRLYSAREPEAHARTMLAVLGELVQAESVVLNVFEVATRKYRVMTLPEQLAQPDEVELVGRYLHQSPFPAYYVATGDARWKMTTDFMPVEDFHATDLHRLGLSRWGINQQICGMLAFVDGAAHAITINRTHRGFEERERLLLDALHPHLVTSYLNALAFADARRSVAEVRATMDAAPGAYGFLREDGTVQWLQDRARQWLADFFSPLDETGLPASVRQLVRESAGRECAARQLEASVAGERLVICLVRSQLEGWVLRLDRSAEHPRLALRNVAGLSAREQEVLVWMVAGKRNMEIGQILGISPRTVEKHVEAILAGLGVENRASAIVRAMELSGGPPEPR